MSNRKGLVRTKYICEKKGAKTWDEILSAIFSNDYYKSSTIFEIKELSNREKRLDMGYRNLKKIIPYIEHITSKLDLKSKSASARCLVGQMVDIFHLENLNKI